MLTIDPNLEMDMEAPGVPPLANAKWLSDAVFELIGCRVGFQHKCGKFMLLRPDGDDFQVYMELGPKHEPFSHATLGEVLWRIQYADAMQIKDMIRAMEVLEGQQSDEAAREREHVADCMSRDFCDRMDFRMRRLKFGRHHNRYHDTKAGAN